MSLLSVRNLHTYFDTYHGVVKAVNGVSFDLEKKKTLGIVGESGSGKSQTVMSILKLFEPNQHIVEGEIWFADQKISAFSDKQLSAIRGNEISVIFQDSIACLNPVFTVENQMCELLMFHRHMKKKQARAEALTMLRAVKIPNPEAVMKRYPHQLSGGMSQRVMIAIALSCRPKILIADEPTTALDVIVQDEILHLMNDLKNAYDTSIIFISHDLGVINEIAEDLIVMNNGKIVEKGKTRDVINNPVHPYTKQLLRAFLLTEVAETQPLEILQEPDDYAALPYTIHWSQTKQADAAWYEVSAGHFVACELNI